MSAQYEIRTVQDLLKIPPERIGECLRHFEHALMLHWLAHGENAPGVELQGLVWTDDGDPSAALATPDGKTWLELKIEKAG